MSLKCVARGYDLPPQVISQLLGPVGFVLGGLLLVIVAGIIVVRRMRR